MLLHLRFHFEVIGRTLSFLALHFLWTRNWLVIRCYELVRLVRTSSYRL